MWHGAGWTFLIFGLLHALYLSINHAWRVFGLSWRFGTIGSVGLTHLAVLLGAVFFRAPGVTSALDLLGGMAGLHGVGFSIPAEPKMQGKLALDVLWLGLLYGVVWAAPNTQEIMGEAHSRLSSLTWRPSLPWAVGFGFAAAVGLLSIGGTGEFLYFQF
jgi:alginate O-acetyltransferase complex protein AlgI